MMKIEAGESEYRLVTADGQEGEYAVYGEPAIIKVGADFYYAYCDVEDGHEELSESQVFRVDSVTAIKFEVEDVKVEDEDEDDEEEEEESEESEEVEGEEEDEGVVIE